MRSLVFLAAPAALLLVSADALAQSQTSLPQETFYRRAPQPPASEWEVKGLLGVEIEARGGLMLPDAQSPVLAPNLYPSSVSGDATGNILRGTESPYGYEPFGVSFTAGYRFLPFLSVGAFFDYASFQVNDGTDTGDYADTTSQLQRQMFQLGAYGRYYYTRLHTRLHPWAELDLGYTEDTASYVRGATQGSAGQPTTTDYYLSFQGIVAAVRLGLDWRIAPFLAVGPVLGYSRSFPVSTCVDVEPQSDVNNPTSLPAKNTCSSPPVEGQGYGMFFGGFFAKVTFGPALR